METVTANIPKELAEKIDRIAKFLGFKDKNEFVAAAVRRLLDHYTVLIKEAR